LLEENEPCTRFLELIAFETPFSSQHANVLAVDEESEENEESSQSNVGYDYLLSMPLWTLTQEKIEELEQQKQDDARQVNVNLNLKLTPDTERFLCSIFMTQLALLEETSASTLWTQDIDNFLEALDAHEREEANAASKQRKRPVKKGRANKAYAEDEDDEDFTGEGAGPRTATKKVRSQQMIICFLFRRELSGKHEL
jgi:DNA topoisomerase-2